MWNRNIGGGGSFAKLLCIAVAGVCCTALHAEVFRCTLPSGKVVYQDSSCSDAPGATEAPTVWRAQRQHDAEKQQQVDAAKARMRAADEIAKPGEKPTGDTTGLNCGNLMSYARSVKGNSTMDSYLIVEEARRQGRCH